MARGLVLSIVKKSCKKIVAQCTIGVRTIGIHAVNCYRRFGLARPSFRRLVQKNFPTIIRLSVYNSLVHDTALRRQSSGKSARY